MRAAHPWEAPSSSGKWVGVGLEGREGEKEENRPLPAPRARAATCQLSNDFLFLDGCALCL